MTPYEEIINAVREYGEAAMENFLRCRALGNAIHDGLPVYMGCSDEHVSLVPAQGPFDPSKEYGDLAFSFAQRPVIRLEPVTFGICLTVPNAEDSGSLWLRAGIRLEITGDTFDIFVSNQPMVHVPIEFDGALTPVWDSIRREFLSVFRAELAHYTDEHSSGGFGFVPNRSEVTTDTGATLKKT